METKKLDEKDYIEKDGFVLISEDLGATLEIKIRLIENKNYSTFDNKSEMQKLLESKVDKVELLKFCDDSGTEIDDENEIHFKLMQKILDNTTDKNLILKNYEKGFNQEFQKEMEMDYNPNFRLAVYIMKELAYLIDIVKDNKKKKEITLNR